MLVEAIPYSKLTTLWIDDEFGLKDEIEEAFKVGKVAQKCLILCFAFEIKRISKQSSFKKFPIDLIRKIKEMIFVPKG